MTPTNTNGAPPVATEVQPVAAAPAPAATRFTLPTEREPASVFDPNFLILYSMPKVGKTTIAAMLNGNLILDAEDNRKRVDAMAVRIIGIDAPPVVEYAETPDEHGVHLMLVRGKGGTYDVADPQWGETREQKVARINGLKHLYLSEIKQILLKNKQAGRVYPYLTLDTGTKLDEWSEVAGTYDYMRTSQGKKFNRNAEGRMMVPTDPGWDTVHSIGDGFGYRWSRDRMIREVEELRELAPVFIMLCHVRDKDISVGAGKTVVISDELDLTGKVKRILCSRANAIGNLIRKGNDVYVSFQTREDVVCGSHSKHLSGKQILLSRSNVDNTIIETYWNRIFLHSPV